MLDVADTDTGAARQHWRAALAVLAIAVAGLTVFHLAPDAPVLAEVSYDLAFAVAGFAATRRMLADGPGRSVARRLVDTWAAAARWALPALVAVVVVVLAISVVLLPPADLKNQAWTALWTALAVSGRELMKQGLYDPAMSSELLLPLWAAGVAAQLVAGWTLAVAAMLQLRLIRSVWGVAGLGVLLSLALELWMRRQGLHQQAFFLSPANAWPFLIGAIVACLPPRAAVAEAAWRSSLARLGDFAWPFYLWLWPLAALPRMILARPLTLVEIAVVVVAAVLLALATHRWIESPARRVLGGRPLSVLALAAVSAVAVALVSAAVSVSDGLPGRADARLRAEEAAVLLRPPLQTVCHVEGSRTPPMAACTTPPGGPADVVVWGNSHAAHLTPAILDWAASRGLRMRQVTKSGCPALLVSADGLASADCLAFNRAAVREMQEGRKPALVILGAAWTVVLARSTGDDRAQAEGLERDLAATVRLVRAAVGSEARIVLLGTTPDFAFAPAACHSRRRYLGLNTRRCDLAPPANARMAAVMDGVLARVAARQPGVVVFDPATALCREGLCRTRSVMIWYADSNHLTPAGGLAQRPTLEPVLDEILSLRPSTDMQVAH